MATRLTAKKSGGAKSAPKTKKIPSKKAVAERAVSDGPTAPAETKPGSKAKRLPAATARALRELEAGELTRYEDADDLFRKLGIKLGKA
jgi:hypothetical protein